MSLWFTLHVGTVPVGFFSARRVKGTIRPDSVGTYAVEVRTADVSWQGSVRHRYGDGVLALVQRGLEAAGDLSKGVG